MLHLSCFKRFEVSQIFLLTGQCFTTSPIPNSRSPHQGKLCDRYGEHARNLSLLTLTSFIASDGQLQPVFGTSASTPVVASMFTMINDARISIGKKTVGFINPAVSIDLQYSELTLRNASRFTLRFSNRHSMILQQVGIKAVVSRICCRSSTWLMVH